MRGKLNTINTPYNIPYILYTLQHFCVKHIKFNNLMFVLFKLLYIIE